jgi:hypothetical protein
MRTRLLVAVVIGLLMAVPLIAGVGAAPLPTATVTLTPSPGEQARGSANLKGFPASDQIWIEMTVRGLAPHGIYAWHVHLGTCAVPLPTVAPVINPSALFGGNHKDLKANADGVAYVVGTFPDPRGILTNGAPYYIDVHERSSTQSGGAVMSCGNFSTNPTTSVLETTLNGAEEVNAQGVPNQGDPDGSGNALILVGPSFVCYNIIVKDIVLPASAAHIHVGVKGTNGPIRVNFTPPPNAQGMASGCVMPADPATIAGLMTTPTNYYVNIHNSVYPPGAVRGQLGD